MANDGSSPRARGGGTGNRRCCGGTLITRVDLLVFLLAAALCSASYCLGIWHNSRGAADSRLLLGPSAAGATYCGDDADGPPLDFETHHAAEDAGLSVSSTAAAKTTSTRRALRGAADGSTARRGVAWAEAGGAGGRSLRFTDAVAVQA
ncbi:unnamed protein product [Miscanthus lutarioriparius]|uniref:Uncharacterized protein n=1 Tax=Miscanthus lutarioriparius TaxID=422564 RepID=A0A811M6Z2_9POAL|nr:unnamed protein product [Miscanthus lutarioriparius]